MSWSVYLMRAAGFDSVRDIPEGWSPPPLGPREAVEARLRAALPGLFFSRPGAGVLRGEGYSIDFILGASDTTAGIQLTASGVNESVLDAIGVAAEVLEAQALALGVGDFIRFRKDPDTGRHVWRNAPHPEQWAPA